MLCKLVYCHDWELDGTEPSLGLIPSLSNAGAFPHPSVSHTEAQGTFLGPVFKLNTSQVNIRHL